MEISANIQQELLSLMQKKWELGEQIIDIQVLKEKMQQTVEELLVNNVEELMQIAYRLDLNEQAVSWAFQQQSVTEIAATFVELILQREVQKIYTRRYFTQHE